jgi:hypothetical protein
MLIRISCSLSERSDFSVVRPTALTAWEYRPKTLFCQLIRMGLKHYTVTTFGVSDYTRGIDWTLDPSTTRTHYSELQITITLLLIFILQITLRLVFLVCFH